MYYNYDKDELVVRPEYIFDNVIEKDRPGYKFIKVVEQEEKTYRCRMDLERFFALAKKNELDAEGRELEDEENEERSNWEV